MEILIQTPVATVGTNSLWFEENHKSLLYRVIALIKFMINLIRIYRDTIVKSKD